MSPPSGSNFCSRCGAALNPGDSFCSRCGSAVGGRSSGTTSGRSSGTTSGRSSGTTSGRSSGRDGFRRRVEDLTVEGWEVRYDYGDRVVMIDRGFGSWGVHALLLIFTGGLGNIPYAWYHYSFGADRLELRADGTERYVSGGDSNRVSAGWSSRKVGSVVVSFFCALIALAILGDSPSDLPTVFVGVTFLFTALFAFPPIRKRLDERKSVTTFGRVRSTDEEVADAPDVPCSACARPVETGVKRTFHETVYVAGFPLTREQKGENCYCRSCARGDPFTGHDLGDVDREVERES